MAGIHSIRIFWGSIILELALYLDENSKNTSQAGRRTCSHVLRVASRRRLVQGASVDDHVPITGIFQSHEAQDPEMARDLLPFGGWRHTSNAGWRKGTLLPPPKPQTQAGLSFENSTATYPFLPVLVAV